MTLFSWPKCFPHYCFAQFLLTKGGVNTAYNLWLKSAWRPDHVTGVCNCGCEPELHLTVGNPSGSGAKWAWAKCQELLEELWGAQQGRANVVCCAWQAVCNVSSQMLEPLKAGLHSEGIANALQCGSDFQWKWWEKCPNGQPLPTLFTCVLHCLHIFIQ